MTKPSLAGSISGSRFGYNPSLDGLRAISIAGVVAGHAGIPRVAGYHGVTVFFVISGYLITSLLANEIARTGSLGFGSFYLRRFARLGPVLLLVTAVTACWLWLTGTSFSTWWAGLVGDLTYTMDIIQAFWGNDHVSEYFQYTWSLAIEEQFYLIWPLLLLILLKWRSINTVLVTLGAAIVAAWVGRAIQDFNHPTHEAQFYGPISHADSLMWGAVIALLVVKFGENQHLDRLTQIAGPIGVAGLLFMLAHGTGFWGLDGADQQGFGQTAVFSAAVILWVARAPRSWFAQLVALKPFALVGKLSYSAYLWNLLTVALFIKIFHSAPSQTPFGLVWLAALFGLCYLSWKFVETPLRRRLSAMRLSRTEVTRIGKARPLEPGGNIPEGS